MILSLSSRASTNSLWSIAPAIEFYILSNPQAFRIFNLSQSINLRPLRCCWYGRHSDMVDISLHFYLKFLISFLQAIYTLLSFPTNLCTSQLVFAIDFISHVFNKSLKKRRKKVVFSSEYFKNYILYCLTQFIHSLK